VTTVLGGRRNSKPGSNGVVITISVVVGEGILTAWGVSNGGRQANTTKRFFATSFWMTPLDTAHAVKIPSLRQTEMVITTPLLPGLELRLPPIPSSPITTAGRLPKSASHRFRSTVRHSPAECASAAITSPFSRFRLHQSDEQQRTKRSAAVLSKCYRCSCGNSFLTSGITIRTKRVGTCMGRGAFPPIDPSHP